MFKKIKDYRERLKDPKARLKFLLWVGWLVVVVLFVIPVAMAMSSNPIFCGLCHENKADIDAWKNSTHSKVTCYGCHAEYGVINFFKDKIKAGIPSAVMKVTRNFPTPINGESELSEEMGTLEVAELTCMANCHTSPKSFTPSASLDTEKVAKESHEKHEENEIGCTICHNRVGHPDLQKYDYLDKEKGEEEMKKAQTDKFGALPWDEGVGAPKEVYADHLEMRYCMECHTGEKGEKKATKDCLACHPKDFPLKPTKSHGAPGFLRPVALGERAIHSRMGKLDEEYCISCHDKKFCSDCHQMEMPHPKANWTTGKKEHAGIGQTNPASCVNCHQGAYFCTDCHHGEQMVQEYKRVNITYTKGMPFKNQHAGIVKATGAQPCFKCHDPRFCAHCHITGQYQLQ